MSEEVSQGRGERVVSSVKGKVSYIACTLNEFAAHKLKLPRLKSDDWLLTLLTAVLTLMIFVFAPLQAAGIFLFQTFAIAGLLVIIGGR